ncbi:branched-chain amino acid ABC transporter permease [Terrabacter aerolatus]|uniref:Branched-chain amino acid ABC transporter permease n=1 Tax=Terrabacter aerolatus TaxID=422442 RepID=A0A512CYF9_9MICO|nr:branched-chain amino acid ABC transporter permease [Terrabacter aerolatus]GEO29248.1 branched-chain amino acid ABC transporter permease [Terrabacter aerolatus]
MSDLVLLIVTGLGLGALYFIAASGLSLIYGLMGVLNFAHGAFITAGAYAAWLTMGALPAGWPVVLRLLVGVLVAVCVGAVVGRVVEVVLIRPLYRHHIQQVLVTVGLSLAGVAAAQGIWGSDPRAVESPAWIGGTTDMLGARLPDDRFVYVLVAGVLFVGLLALLHLTRLGLVIRAGVENRTMVEALGIDVHRTFTVVFALGGAAAALAGALYSQYAGAVSPAQGGSLLIYAFIVVVIGGMGSLTGTAVAAVAVGLVQQLANYYAATGVGDLSVVLLLALVLLLRPTSLKGATA